MVPLVLTHNHMRSLSPSSFAAWQQPCPTRHWQSCSDHIPRQSCTSDCITHRHTHTHTLHQALIFSEVQNVVEAARASGIQGFHAACLDLNHLALRLRPTHAKNVIGHDDIGQYEANRPCAKLGGSESIHSYPPQRDLFTL